MDAYRFECGRKSMTNQIKKIKLEPILVGKDGVSYSIDKWANSQTFWISNQENLLVSDNQTAIYQNANELYRQHLSRLAWGTP